MILRSFLAILFLFTSASFVLGQELPDDGKRLVDAAALTPAALKVYDGEGKFAEKSIQSSDHPEIDKSLRVRVVERPQNTWDVSIHARSTAAVAKGDAVLTGFWARGKATEGVGGGVAELVYESSSAPHTKSVQYLIETPADGSWKKFWVRCKAKEGYAAGESGISFQLGYLRDEFEVANVQVWRFDASKFESLPHTPLTYVGRELDSPWRADADKRIDRHRKADIEITVVDENDQPVQHKTVHVHLDRHAFGFGTAASVDMLSGEGPDHDRYRETLKRQFNIATIENGLKWRVWEDESRQSKTLDAAKWLTENNVTARGHVMIWPGHRYLPDWVTALQEQPEVLRKVLDTHIREMGYATRGLVQDWDVLNEVFDNPDLTNTLGDEAMTRWFQVADGVAPDVDLYYNDYAGLVRGGHPTVHKDHFEKTIRYLVDNKAPIDGIGIQSHFGSLLTPPERILSELDRWSQFGLKIMITEFDVSVPDEQLRAEFTRDFIISCFSHPSVDGIITWGFWEGSHWRPEAALYKKDWSLTPLGEAWTKLTQETWTTDERLTTDKNGRISSRGFRGDYTMTMGERNKRSFTLGKQGIQLTIKHSE